MLEFILGLTIGVALCILIINIFPRLLRRGHDRSGVDRAIGREGELQGNINDTSLELSNDIESARDRTSERFDEAREQVQSGNSSIEDSVTGTDRIIDDIKKRNNLE